MPKSLKTEKISFRDVKEMVELIDDFKKIYKFEERSDAIRHIIRHFILEYMTNKKIFSREELIKDYENLKKKLISANDNNKI